MGTFDNSVLSLFSPPDQLVSLTVTLHLFTPFSSLLSVSPLYGIYCFENLLHVLPRHLALPVDLSTSSVNYLTLLSYVLLLNYSLREEI